jgi:hypothetical protein
MIATATGALSMRIGARLLHVTATNSGVVKVANRSSALAIQSATKTAAALVHPQNTASSATSMPIVISAVSAFATRSGAAAIAKRILGGATHYAMAVQGRIAAAARSE